MCECLGCDDIDNSYYYTKIDNIIHSVTSKITKITKRDKYWILNLEDRYRNFFIIPNKDSEFVLFQLIEIEYVLVKINKNYNQAWIVNVKYEKK